MPLLYHIPLGNHMKILAVNIGSDNIISNQDCRLLGVSQN